MRIVIDENIADAEEVFSRQGNVILLPGREISNEVLKDADALVVRSITNVNEKLLKGTKVKFVGTATIGRDHIDIDYLNKNNIAFADAKGCNAEAVKEYFLTVITEAVVKNKLRFKDLTIGIVGVGNIGSKAAKCAEVLGMKSILNDPPVKRKTGDEKYRDLEEVLSADIITMHVPLNKEGADKTVHLFDTEKLNMLKDGCIIINSSRGSVIDNDALQKITGKKNLTVILDVWENEPEINKALLEKVFYATPHIAGYTYEGKINGTMMIYSALCSFLKVKDEYSVEAPEVEDSDIKIDTAESIEKTLQFIFRRVYDIRKDDANMRKILNDKSINGGKHFDKLRKDYSLRREFNNYIVSINKEDKNLKEILTAFRFKVK